VSTQIKPTVPFTLALIGGLIIIVGGLFSFFCNGNSGVLYGMMNGTYGYYGTGFWLALSSLSIISGIIVILGAIMLNSRPTAHMTWGIIILVFAIVSFVGMGGFLIGAILSLIGGAFAINWKPQVNTPN
jgi:hypothetical protein